MKYINEIRKEFNSSNFPVFKIQDIKTILGIKGASDAYIRLLVYNMLKRGEIIRITRGIYTFHIDEATVAGFAYLPFYYGLEDALSERGISLQGTNPFIITTRNVRTGVRQFKGRNYLIKRIPAKYFFGYELVRYYDFWIPVSDVEKTVIDMIYFRYHISYELWPGIIEKLDKQKLQEYLKKYSKRFSDKVMSMCENEIKKGDNPNNIVVDNWVLSEVEHGLGVEH